MSTFHSGFAGHIEDFIRYRKASGIWNATYEKTYSCLTTIVPILFRLAILSVRI